MIASSLYNKLLIGAISSSPFSFYEKCRKPHILVLEREAILMPNVSIAPSPYRVSLRYASYFFKSKRTSLRVFQKAPLDWHSPRPQGFSILLSIMF